MSLTVLWMWEFAARAAAPSNQESARLQYARAYVQLTRLQLQIAQARNQEIPDTLPRAVMAGLQEHIILSEVWFRDAECREAGKPYNVALETATILSEFADAKYANAVKLKDTLQTAPRQLELLRMKAELARLRVASAKQIDVNSPAALVQFQVERLREGLAELKEQAVRIGDID
jgi:hypothetical protein